MVFPRFPWLVAVVFVCSTTAWGATPPDTPAATVDFASQIQPLLSKKCFACHGPDESSRKGKLRLDSFADATAARRDRAAVVPGNPEASELLRRITTHDPDDVMPPPEMKNSLKPEEVEILRRWIAQGADYSPHWAWIPPKRPPLPEVKVAEWSRNGIDRFIAAQLEANGLAPSPAADRYTLIRRLSLDLTGLPPTAAEVQTFVEDQRPDAYERLVDRLLASPHFGERWARMWLDLGRYADSAGYGSDPLRPNIWPWRDWLIDALNDNLPFDQFTRDLLAGDLVENGTDEQKVASAFHRNTMTNTEGGTDDEEWRVAAVKDRAGVTAQVWMGLTMNCAQCHTHKFDPISHHEYYAFYSFFNQTADNDQPDERPTLPVYSRREQEQRAALQTEISRVEAEYRAPQPAFEQELLDWARRAAAPVAWIPLSPDAVTSSVSNAPSFTIQSDGAVLVSGGKPNRDSYLVRATANLPRLTAVQLEVLPDSSLPKGGPGRADNGSFVVNDLRLELLPSTEKTKPVQFVRVEAPGDNRILSLAEVQVFSGGTNVALRGVTRQSSTDYLGDSNRAVDGNTDGNYGESNSTTHTRMETDPWWEVDLGAEYLVEQVAIWNRTDGGVGTRLANARVFLLNAQRQPSSQELLESAPNPVAHVGPAAPRPLKLVRASASASQPDSPASEAIDADAGRNSGWSVGEPDGRAYRWVAELDEPLESGQPVSLRIALAQNFGEGRTLGKFRLSVTDHATPVRVYPPRVEAALAVASAQWSAEDRQSLDDQFRPESETLGAKYRELVGLRSQLEAVRGTPVPVMQDLAKDVLRVTRILNKGNFLDPGDPVSPDIPAAFNPWPAQAPLNRLGLAHWLTAPDNPLTARVAVNRFWSQLMGQALVETEEDFGTQGTLPTNRPLLDWLAVSFQSPKVAGRSAADPWNAALGWDFKALVKLIVTSATYQQSSVLTADGREKDPLNQFYSRAPRRRLDAETVRDQALRLSGLLSQKIGGPSVYPMQPDGLWRAAFNGERNWSTSEGEDRYRRGIYTFWRRTVPYPSMATFDAPSRETCTLRRQPTNTPLQAFVTLNDPAFVECAQALGRRLAEGPGPVAERVRRGLEEVLARPASEAAVAGLMNLYESELSQYQNNPKEARDLATIPLGPLPPGLTPAEVAAWTTVGNVLLNLDGVLMKN